MAVPDLFTVETYPTLHTLTSTVTGRLRPGVTASQVLRAMFPCGSVTGAPKIRAMEIIRDLKDEPRGAYTGSIGMISPSGDMRFNVAIRTAAIRPDGERVYGVGGGIVADSDAEAEYAECRLKARVLTDVAEEFGLIETFRWAPAEGFLRLDRHLERLAGSAESLGFAFREDAARAQLQALAGTFAGSADRRVRIALSRDGSIELTHSALGDAPPSPMKVTVAGRPFDPADPFLRHKTTRRARFEEAFAEAERRGFEEAVLLNRHGFVAETTRGSVFVEADGVLLTPALRHGLLPGILRQELLDAGGAREADLRVEDLQRARQWFVGNSLRGLREARLAAPS